MDIPAHPAERVHLAGCQGIYHVNLLETAQIGRMKLFAGRITLVYFSGVITTSFPFLSE
jgi:hypothetical protein